MHRLNPPKGTVHASRPSSGATLVCLLVLTVIMAGCNKTSDRSLGDARRGPALMAHFGCGTCHSIPGVPGAIGQVGPPLDNIGARTILAGFLSNTPDNMVAWLEKPQSIVPGNAMPDMEIDDHDAKDITAYLLTLR